MSTPVTIDALAVARRVIEDPRKRFTIAADEILALCGCLVALDEEPDEQPTTNAVLAAAVASVVQLNGLWQTAERACNDDASDAAQDKAGDALIALSHALDTLTTAFEREFPDV